MHIYFGVMLLGLVGICAGAEKWDYKDPSEWKKVFPICGEKSQSPVDIVNARCAENLNESLKTDKYGTKGSSKFTLLNNGHTLQLNTGSTGANIKLAKGGPQYDLVQVHFHWGKNNNNGSEHMLNGKYYPAEMHLVHYNTTFGSVGVAQSQTQGLAVLGVFIEVGTENNDAFKFLESVEDVVNASTNVTVEQFAMEKLLPKNRDLFYRYSGSLTTPKCFQSVTWTVFNETIKISQEQLDKFRSVKDLEGKKLVNNFRPVQELNGRKITYWDNECPESGARVVGASIITVLLSVLFFFTA